MHKAPAVDYPVGRSRAHLFFLIAVWVVVVGVNALWFGQIDAVDWRQWVGLTITALTALTANHVWRASPEGTLSWDGSSWWWASSGFRVAGVVTPHLDLQEALLLGFDAQSGTRYWCWLERNASVPRWNALRQATFAHGKPEADAAKVEQDVESDRRGGKSAP